MKQGSRDLLKKQLFRHIREVKSLGGIGPLSAIYKVCF